MLDADMTYPFDEIPHFVEELRDGAQLVMGDRMDNIQPGAMHWVNRYIGNPLLSGTLNLFFRTGIRDAHCGMRGFRRDILPTLDLRTTGMEFASEMVIRASKEKLDIREFPISYAPRGGETKLVALARRLAPPALPARPQPDAPVHRARARRCSRSACSIALDLAERRSRSSAASGTCTRSIAGELLCIVGTQIVALGLCAHAYGTYFMGEKDPWFDRMRARYRLEHGLMLGGAILARRASSPRRSSSASGSTAASARCRRSAWRSTRRDAHHRRPADLLLVVPAVDPRAAPART